MKTGDNASRLALHSESSNADVIYWQSLLSLRKTLHGQLTSGKIKHLEFIAIDKLEILKVIDYGLSSAALESKGVF